MSILKPDIIGKHCEKQQATENQKNTKYKLSGGPVFDLACQEGGSHPCSPSVTPLYEGIPANSSVVKGVQKYNFAILKKTKLVRMR